ncbi:MAG: hypothetical protein O0V67_08965 [Methanocorpusculum sp.]|nr:hypothetical protein [Methanocorpusculum sp.]
MIMVAFKASGAADAAIKFVADYCTASANVCSADFADDKAVLRESSD